MHHQARRKHVKMRCGSESEFLIVNLRRNFAELFVGCACEDAVNLIFVIKTLIFFVSSFSDIQIWP